MPVRMASSPPGTVREHRGQPGRVGGRGVEPVAGQAAAPGRVMAWPGRPAGGAVGDRALGPAEHEHRPARRMYRSAAASMVSPEGAISCPVGWS